MTFSIRPAVWDELPPVTRVLAFSFLFGWALETAFRKTINYYFGLVPIQVLGWGWLWQPFTYIFIHANFVHFLFNAFMLWMLGSVVERELGPWKFFSYFLFCGAAAGFFTVFADPGSTRAVIGASGAVCGLLYAFAALYPERTVYMYLLFPMSARQFVIVMAAVSLLLSFATPNSVTANFTHLSGLAAGWLYFRARGRLRFPGWNIFSRTYLWCRRLFTHASEDEAARVDALLAKVSRSGEYSLTSEERQELAEYAKRRGGRA